MRVLLFIFALAALAVLHSSHFQRQVIYLEASNKPFKVAPVERWTTEIPNARHRDKCVFNDYKCPEQFFLMLTI
jgi:hypothetical protein